MRHLIFLIISNSIFNFAIGQNLVPNGGFDNLNHCPSNYNDVTAASSWYPSQNNHNPNYGTECMNACNSGNFNVPNGTWGFQQAFSGNGYMAISSMAPSVSANYRENIYAQLINPLIIGASYNVSFYLSHTDNSKHSSNNFGVKFSTVPDFPINNISHVYTQNIISDNINWIQISQTFVADSAYNYICLGNFFNDASTLTTTSCSSCPYNLYGYFLDDVSVVKLEVGINENVAETQSKFELYPNPGDGFITVKSKAKNITTIEIKDTIGKIILRKKLDSEEEKLNISEFECGIYFISLMDENGMKYTQKYVKGN